VSGGDPWALELTPAALRGLDRLPEKAATAVLELLPAIAENPYRVGKPLHLELEGQRAARRGPYRVVYGLDEEERIVTVSAVGHRADVYRSR
jgi:mRNA-degrading endonuclease RelE of RelBE toxin-antitoxin system